MIIFLIGLLTFIGLIAAGSIFVYFSVIYKQNCVKKSYKLIDTLLQKRYALISSIISNIQPYYNDSAKTSYILSLRNEVMTIGTKLDNIDRRFAFDSELSRNMQVIVDSITNLNIQDNTELCNMINTYIELDKKIKACAKIYNKNAKSLRHAVDVFPSSFISRLNNIKYTNLFQA